MALLESVGSACCSTGVDTSQKERQPMSCWSHPGLRCEQLFPFGPLGKSFWEISREIPWKGTNSQGERFSGQEVICVVENTPDTDCLFSWCPWPQTLQLKRNDTELLSYVCYLLEIQPHPHFALLSYKILHNFGVILGGLSSVLVFVAEFASPAGLFLSGAQKCMSGKEKCLFCLFVLIDPIFLEQF